MIGTEKGVEQRPVLKVSNIPFKFFWRLCLCGSNLISGPSTFSKWVINRYWKLQSSGRYWGSVIYQILFYVIRNFQNSPEKTFFNNISVVNIVDFPSAYTSLSCRQNPDFLQALDDRCLRGSESKTIIMVPLLMLLCSRCRAGLCDPMEYSQLGCSVHGISWRILEWVAISCSRGSS